jgi:hypothetical protein
VIGPISGAPPLTVWAYSCDPRTITTQETLAANFAILNAFTVDSPLFVDTAFYGVGVQSGNVDFGIYDGMSGNRLASTGSTACPVSGNAFTLLTAGITLVPGNLYYVAYACDNGTVTITKRTPGVFKIPPIRIGGVQRLLGVQSAASFPLPANISMPGAATQHVIGVAFAWG